MKTANELDKTFTDLHHWLQDKDNFLVVTHQRPDGDASGSVMAFCRTMRAMGKSATPYFHEEPAQNLLPFLDDTVRYGDIDLQPFKTLICLDCANAPRLALPNNMDIDDFLIPVGNIDHHVTNEGYGSKNAILVDAESAATCEILAIFFSAFDYPMPPQAATSLLVGLTQDTGCFRFTNTSSQCFDVASWLLEKEGDYQKVMQELYFNNPINVLRLQAKVIEATHFAFDNRLAWFHITDELLESCDTTADDADELVDIIRTIKGIEIVVRLQELKDCIRFSMRSQNPDRPILGLASKLGGGGHKMAAGATMENATLDEATRIMLNYAKELFDE